MHLADLWNEEDQDRRRAEFARLALAPYRVAMTHNCIGWDIFVDPGVGYFDCALSLVCPGEPS